MCHKAKYKLMPKRHGHSHNAQHSNALDENYGMYILPRDIVGPVAPGRRKRQGIHLT